MVQSIGRMLSAALKYARLGWKVFPLAEANDLKTPHPMLGKQEGHNLATDDPEQITKWWTSRPNAGIGGFAAASGLIVVDIDLRDSGDVAMTELEAIYGPLRSMVTATTGGGGEHRFFAAPEGLRSPPGKVHGRKGIDLKYNGYVVLPPSPHSTRVKNADGTVSYPRSATSYRWKPGLDPFQNADFIGYLPDWVLKSDMPARVNGHSHNPFVEDTAKVGLSVAEIEAELTNVPNTGDAELDYEDWLKVLLAVYHETDGSEEGRAAALAWSERAMKHEAERFEKSWRSADIEGKDRAPVTFRYILKLAKEHRLAVAAELEADLKQEIIGADNMPAFAAVANKLKSAELPPLARMELLGLFRKAYKRITGELLPISEARRLTRYENAEGNDLPHWLRGWIYCALDDEFAREGTTQSVSVRAFNHMFNRNMLTNLERKEGKMVPDIQASDAALNGFEIPIIHARMYAPLQPLYFSIDNVDYLNTFSADHFPEVPDELTTPDVRNIAFLEKHFALLMPRQRDRELVLSWMAHIVQTNSRVNWTPILQGPQGLGKTFLSSMLGAILGSRNVKVIDPELLKAPHTDWAEGSLVTVFEEVKLHGADRYAIIDKLKPYITNQAVNVHPKGYKARTVINTASYMGLTNYRDALPLDATDTRYFSVASALQTKQEVEAFAAARPNYYSLLFSALNESAGAIRKWFLNYRLHIEFNPNGRAPRSAEKELMIEMGRSDAEATLLSLLAEGGECDLSSALLNSNRLVDYLTEQGVEVPHTTAIRTMLVNRMGFTPLGRFKIAGAVNRYWSRTPEAFVRPDLTQTARLIRCHLASEGL